jgi:ribosomal protein S18 acetylase RimI-like enzyme
VSSPSSWDAAVGLRAPSGDRVSAAVGARRLPGMSPDSIDVRQLTPADHEWAADALATGLGGRLQARRGELIDVLEDEGLIAWLTGRRVGLLTHRPDGVARMELSALLSVDRGRGVATALVAELVRVARASGMREIRVTTTNDNLTALAFYQRRGFRLVELRAGAVDASRRTIKPAIGEVGPSGLPIRDEIELALEV